MMANKINGGVTAPEGFFAAGVACGIKKDGKKDLALVCTETPAAVAGVYTRNSVKGHSLKVTMEHAKNGYASAIVINSGNANACVGPQGYKDAKEMAALTASLIDCATEEVLVGSTGVIGKALNMPLVRSGIRNLAEAMGPDGGADAAEAIMTTDLRPKEIAVELEIQEKQVRIGAMCKGSGMIHPNMATMIAIITTDLNIKPSLLDAAFKECVNKTFNRISVDGDTSVCDMVLVFANGMAENDGIFKQDFEYENFKAALLEVCTFLAKSIVRDGEGATKLIEVEVTGAKTPEDAYTAASAVARSPLFKTAMYGNDANWGRILNAVGYSGAEFDQNLTDVWIGKVMCCQNGCAVNFDEAAAKLELQKDEVKIRVDLKMGQAIDKYWTCDFSEKYVEINGSYRT